MKLPGRRHMPFYVGAVAGAVVAAGTALIWPDLAVEAGANTFFLVYLVLCAIKMPHLDAAFLKKHAAQDDEPAAVILLVTFSAVVVVIASLFVLINAPKTPTWLELCFSLASVALGWATIHTMAAFHYAHIYWQPVDDEAKDAEPDLKRGLDFPDTPDPSGYDFLYFAVVLGMTAQTSDVGITDTRMRKLALLHSVVSYFFNTVLVAASVNLAVSVGH